MAKANEGSGRLPRILVAMFVLFVLYSIGTMAMGWYTVEKMTEQMKPVCVGRFLVDLPAEMDFSYSHTFMYGFWVAAIPESKEAFLQRVSAREAEINAQPNERGEKNMEKVTPVSVHGFTGKIFRFGRTSVEGLENEQTVYYVNVSLEGYVHAENTTFTFKVEDIDPDRTDILGQMIDKLRVVAPNEIPSAPGFCFGRGMLVDPVPIKWTEGVRLFAGFRRHPDLALSFNTRAGLGPDPNDPGLLARDARADAELSVSQRARIKKLRIGRRNIRGIDGEEVLEGGTELNFVNVYTLHWEVIGTKDNAFLPDMHLEMSTGHPGKAGAPPVPTFLDEHALVQLWDKISSSIRVRPAKPDPPAEAENAPSGPKLGDSAAAGDSCPESGWWQCADGGDRVGVLGGQRQFMRKSQRMPQALLLPPQTPWEKIRGVQRSYQGTQPTSWTLTDRRSKARVRPDIALAPALGQQGSTSIPSTAMDGPPARTGIYAGTGMPCPASGWWQCQDSEACDGTRWFAQGDLLPAATFRLGQQGIRFLPRPTEVFQRRSSWKLVRPASEPDEDSA